LISKVPEGMDSDDKTFPKGIRDILHFNIFSLYLSKETLNYISLF